MASEITHADELAVLERLEAYSGVALSDLSEINKTLRHHDFRLDDLRLSPYSSDERLKLFSVRERALVRILLEQERKLAELLPVRDVLFHLAELKEPERDAAGAAFTIVLGGLSLAVLSSGILWWTASANGGIDDWGAAAFMYCVGAAIFAWGYGVRKRDELRARRVWRSARKRAGF